MRRLSLVLLAVAAPSSAQQAVTSPAPDRVAVTVYRAPWARGAIDLRNVSGFALVTETRRIRLPRGAATLRFEGVAEGIVPVSAIVDGLPGGTIEKNRDARLLSPASLVDGSLGRQVTLTRTDPATGKRVSEQATIVAGPQPGVVLRTVAGIEALRCSGLPERLGFSRPPGLSAKPVLSVATTTPTARTVTVRLTYLSSGFDWRASYVATVSRGADRLDLSAWLTLANANPETFAQAEVQAVAGRLNRRETAPIPRAVGALRLACFPLGTTTSDLRERTFEKADIIVTASRMIAPSAIAMAPPPPPPPAPPPPPPPEDLGDLKLYRVPERTDVAPRAQKQVALLARQDVPFRRRYRLAVGAGDRLDAVPTAPVLVIVNDAAAGLGIPLPAGSTALYASRGDQRLLVGLGTLADRTTGETIRLAAGTSTQVTVTQKPLAKDEAQLTVRNANGFPVTMDLPIGRAGQKIDASDPAAAIEDGILTWTPTVPANGEATLRYRYGL